MRNLRSKRKKITVFCLLLGFLFAALPVGMTQAGGIPTSKMIRVGIVVKQKNVEISGTGSFEMRDANNKTLLKAQNPGEKWQITSQDKGLTVNGKNVFPGPLRICLTQTTTPVNAFIMVDQHRYRGEIEIRKNTDGTLTVVNELPVDEYLYGVVPREMSPNWPLEALKAQAVAARTYTLVNMGKHSSEGFDLCNTTHCQVYGGVDSEGPLSNQAVDATKGKVATYQGKMISAVYHSTSGGYTENSENVWGTFTPYLRAVEDYDQSSPRYNWTKTFTPQQLQGIFANNGMITGLVYNLEPLERGVSGRIKTLRVWGTQGTFELSGEKLRWILGLDSTLFDVKVKAGPTAASTNFVVNASNKVTALKQGNNVKVINVSGKSTAKALDGVKVISAGGISSLKAASGQSNTPLSFELVGRGWGHGLGMSQWGAKAMAEKAPANDTEYYQKILKHYYQGIEITQAY